MGNKIGMWAFLIGLIVAVLAVFITGYAKEVAVVLFILGLVVGFLNINDKDLIKFLVAVIALASIGTASLGALAILGTVSAYISSIVLNFVAFVSAAGLVVAIKAIVEAAK